MGERRGMGGYGVSNERQESIVRFPHQGDASVPTHHLHSPRPYARRSFYSGLWGYLEVIQFKRNHAPVV